MPNRNRYTWTYYKCPELYESYLDKISNLLNFQFSIAQVELCPKTKRVHIQGYTEFTESTPIAVMRSVLIGISSDACQVSKGTQAHNITYCTKKESQLMPPIERGIPAINEQGKRNDINKSMELIKSTGSMRQVVNSTSSYQAVRMCEKYLQYNEPERPILTSQRFIWISGPTGTGKTRYVYDHYNDIHRPVTFKWWDGYDQHETILLDDFRRDFCKFHELLTLTDIYPFRVETKGGTRQVQFTTIIITSPYEPEEVYSTREDVNQLVRRITDRIRIDDNGIHLYEPQKKESLGNPILP